MSFPEARYDVVLVNPPAAVVREHWDTPDFPQIALGYLGGYLERHEGIRPAILDAKLSRLEIDQTVEAIVALRPRVVGLTSVTFTIKVAEEIANGVRHRWPDVKIVLGGFHASSLPERTAREFDCFDALVVGEGEIAFAKLVRLLLTHPDKAIADIPEATTIAGVCFLRDGEFIDNGRGEIPADLDALGEPAWHLFDKEVMTSRCRMLQVMSQRGCPFGCPFCSRPYGQRVRKRSPKSVVDEIERGVREFGITRFAFNDETFTVDSRHVEGICREILARGLQDKMHWDAMVHANTVSREGLLLMKEAGCAALYFGVESGNDAILAAMKKGVNKERILRCAKWMKEAKLHFGALFILGHPGETRRSILQTILFAAKINAPHTAFGIMVPYPGTEIWHMALEGRGGYRKLSPRWEDFNKQIGNAVELEKISRRELEFSQMAAYALCYLLNGRFLRLVRSLFDHRSRLKYLILKNLRLPLRRRKVSDSDSVPAS